MNSGILIAFLIGIVLGYYLGNTKLRMWVAKQIAKSAPKETGKKE